MRVAIVGDGTTGDLQPFCGLAYALYARQHEVLVIANENHRAMLAPLVKAGVVLSATYIPVDVQHILKNDVRVTSPLARGDYWRFLAAFVEIVGETAIVATPLTLDALRQFQPQIIVSGTVPLPRCVVLSEVLGVPLFHGNYIPLRPSTWLWPMLVGGPPHGSETAARIVLSGVALAAGGGLFLAMFGAMIAPAVMNRFVGNTVERLILGNVMPSYNQVRAGLGLHPQTGPAMRHKVWNEIPFLPSYSPALFRRSTAEAAEAAGYWYGPEWTLVEEEGMRARDSEWSNFSPQDQWSNVSERTAVENFIKSARRRGKRVVSIGWGSMIVLSKEHLSALAAAAAAIADVAVILIGGWSGITSKSLLVDGAAAPGKAQGCSAVSTQDKRAGGMVAEANAVLQARDHGMTLAKWLSTGGNAVEVEAIAHSFLFKRMDCVVHHGGAGTTASSARSGTPTVITPVMSDQDGWGARMKSVGAGIRARNITQLSATELARHIQYAATSAKMRACAQDLKDKVLLDGGAAEAVRKLEDAVRKDRP
jgi:hypothetical protein